MSWSLGEARSLSIKAARGAGLAWGLAEETGFAVRWLQAQGAPGLRALAAYLRAREEAGGQEAAACPIELGCRLLDGGLVLPCDLGQVSQPLLLVPFIAAATPAGTSGLAWDGVELLVAPEALESAAPTERLLTARATCRATGRGARPLRRQRWQRVPESEGEAMIALTAFAARTYAPASEQSRLAGAGAGLNDND